MVVQLLKYLHCYHRDLISLLEPSKRDGRVVNLCPGTGVQGWRIRQILGITVLEATLVCSRLVREIVLEHNTLESVLKIYV